MKTFFALTCCAALLAGCDFAGGSADGPAVELNSLTISDYGRTAQQWDADGTAPNVIVEITDGAGRALFQSELMVDVAMDSLSFDLSGTELNVNGLGKFIYVFHEDARSGDITVIAQSEAFTTEQLEASGTVTLSRNERSPSPISAEVTATPVAE